MNFKYNEKYRFIEYKYKNKTTTIWLTQIQSKLFNVLKDRQAHTYQELIKAMYDVEDNKFYIKNVRTNISRLNKELKYFGKIVGISKVGYKLRVIGDEQNE